MTDLRYASAIERPAPAEQETVDGIIAGMTQQPRTVEARERHPVRASHAKDSTCALGAGRTGRVAPSPSTTPGGS